MLFAMFVQERIWGMGVRCLVGILTGLVSFVVNIIRLSIVKGVGNQFVLELQK